MSFSHYDIIVINTLLNNNLFYNKMVKLHQKLKQKLLYVLYSLHTHFKYSLLKLRTNKSRG